MGGGWGRFVESVRRLRRGWWCLGVGCVWGVWADPGLERPSCGFVLWVGVTELTALTGSCRNPDAFRVIFPRFVGF
jgi:hypothetical protein